MSRTITTRAGLLAALAAAALLCACETPLDRAWSRSYRDHLAATTANPEAGRDALEAVRPDGASADAALYKFRSGEEKTQAPPPSIINLNVGGS